MTQLQIIKKRKFKKNFDRADKKIFQKRIFLKKRKLKINFDRADIPKKIFYKKRKF